MGLNMQIYIPDQELYPGKFFSSFVEMKQNCPLLDERAEWCTNFNINYVPYKAWYPPFELRLILAWEHKSFFDRVGYN